MVVQRVKRLVVDQILEPLVPLRRLEAYAIYLGRLVFRIRKPLIIAITGSVGKSTTTAVVAAVLSCAEARKIVGSVGETVGNMNDNLGVAATLLRFDDVLELPWNYLERILLFFSLPLRMLRALLGPYPKVMVLECGVGDTANLRELVTLAPPTGSCGDARWRRSSGKTEDDRWSDRGKRSVGSCCALVGACSTGAGP